MMIQMSKKGGCFAPKKTWVFKQPLFIFQERIADTFMSAILTLMERITGLEPATSTLARSRSTK